MSTSHSNPKLKPSTKAHNETTFNLVTHTLYKNETLPSHGIGNALARINGNVPYTFPEYLLWRTKHHYTELSLSTLKALKDNCSSTLLFVILEHGLFTSTIREHLKQSNFKYSWKDYYHSTSQEHLNLLWMPTLQAATEMNMQTVLVSSIPQTYTKFVNKLLEFYGIRDHFTEIHLKPRPALQTNTHYVRIWNQYRAHYHVMVLSNKWHNPRLRAAHPVHGPRLG